MSAYRALAEAMRPRLDRQTLANARRAITNDGRPRLDRGAGNLPRETLVVLSADSVRTEPTVASSSDNAQDQLGDQANLSEVYAPLGVATASATTSVNPTPGGTEVAADLNYAGTGGNFGSADTPARSNHAHAGVYAPVPLTATASLNFPNIVAHTCQELTISVPGAVVNAAVVLGPDDTLSAGLTAIGYVSAAGVVTVRACNITASDINPSAHTWRATVL